MKALKIEGCTVVPVNIENTLDALQAAVDGYIEAVTLIPSNAVMIVNEEGLLRGMPYNAFATLIAAKNIVGPALVVGVDGEEFTDFPTEIRQQIDELFA